MVKRAVLGAGAEMNRREDAVFCFFSEISSVPRRYRSDKSLRKKNHSSW